VPGYHRNLALLLVKQQAWADAEAVCRHWLRLDPMSAEAHATRLRCLLATGDKAEARKVFARIEALAPDNLQELRIRFEKKLR
jgi:tetratricopeptide (TPR) repeat protein